MKFTKRNKLIFLISVMFAFGVIHNILDSDNDQSTDFLTWHFVMGLGFGIFTIGYAYLLKCPVCRAKQVFRGDSFFDLRIPTKKCYLCGCDIDQQNRGS